MGRRSHQRTCVAFALKMSKSTRVLIPHGDIKYLYEDTRDRSKSYAIKSPLTNEWMEFTVKHILVSQGVLPEIASQISDYYAEMKTTMEHARIYQPLKGDLTAFDDEEARIFGVKGPERHPW